MLPSGRSCRPAEPTGKFKIQWLVVGTVCVPAKFPAKRLVLIQGRGYHDCGDHLVDVSHCFGKVFDTGGAGHLGAAEEATIGR